MSAGARDHQLPRWLLIAAVLGSGLLTGWAMWRTRATGPQSSWDRVEQAVGQVWAQPPPVSPYAPMQPSMGAPMTATAAAAMPPPEGSMVARVLGAPPILWGANRPHGDRGSCTQCHSVLQRNGRQVPMILSSASMPHEFRGICSNCHSIMGNGPVGPLPVAMPVPQGPGSPAPQTPAGAQPREVEWRGIEARPGAQGVTVNNVDGTAQRAGVMPGDVIVSLNGAPVTSMAQLEALTMNGTLPLGTIIVQRAGQRMAFEIRDAPGVGIAAPPSMPLGPSVQPQLMPGM